VAEVTEGFCQKTKVAVPEELVRADGEVGVEKNFQGGGAAYGKVTQEVMVKYILI
jgi:hypothetical protein